MLPQGPRRSGIDHLISNILPCVMTTTLPMTMRITMTPSVTPRMSVGLSLVRLIHFLQLTSGHLFHQASGLVEECREEVGDNADSPAECHPEPPLVPRAFALVGE